MSFSPLPPFVYAGIAGKLKVPPAETTTMIMTTMMPVMIDVTMTKTTFRKT